MEDRGHSRVHWHDLTICLDEDMKAVKVMTVDSLGIFISCLSRRLLCISNVSSTNPFLFYPHDSIYTCVRSQNNCSDSTVMSENR